MGQRLFILVCAVALLVLVPRGAQAEMLRHDITPATAKISFSADYLSFLETEGGFTRFSGWFETDPDALDATRAELVIESASLFSTEPDWQEDLEGTDFFNVREFREIRFVAVRVTREREGKGLLEGRITIRGITRMIRFDLTYAIELQADGHRRISRIEATGRIDRRQFGMTAWGLVLSDEVEIRIVVEPEVQPSIRD